MRQNFAEILKRLNEADEELSKLSFNFDYKQHKKFTIIVIIFINTFHFMMCTGMYLTQEYYRMNMGLNTMVVISWGFLVNYDLIDQFIFAVCGVKERCRAIKDVLR
jgi:uncharacterized membrane protein (DUF106 family)